ncbi:MAG: hypothetical protein PUC47_13135 [Oscillospiraceae bacterium]|nr:hypothetical protein [Oscillospiraceae bacterium]
MNRNDIIELSRRLMANTDEGMACGPGGLEAADAEIVVCDEGREIFLHGQWVSECADEILLEATLESVYDIYEQMNRRSGEECPELLAERDRICAAAKADPFLSGMDAAERYAKQLAQIREMLLAKAEEMGYELCDEDMDEEMSEGTTMP